MRMLEVDAFPDRPAPSPGPAILQHAGTAAVIAGHFGWSDIGDWSTVWQVSEKGKGGNVVQGRGYVLDGVNNLVRSDEAVVAVVGLDDVAVIATRDAVLVTSRAQAGRVRDAVALVAANHEPEAVCHREIHRPWGKYLSVDLDTRHQVKRITVKPSGVLSLQKHHHRAEHWVVVRGTAEVTRDDETILVHENESIYLPIGCVHRMANPGKIPPRDHRGPGRLLSRRGRHHPDRRHLPALLRLRGRPSGCRGGDRAGGPGTSARPK